MSAWRDIPIELELEADGETIVRCRWRTASAPAWRSIQIAQNSQQTLLDLVTAVLALIALELRAAAA